MKCSGAICDQHVEADVALDAEADRLRHTAEARAPNCTVFEVIAKYASQMSRGLSPELSAIATRVERRQPGRRREARVEPADREHEARAAAPNPSARAAPSRR